MNRYTVFTTSSINSNLHSYEIIHIVNSLKYQSNDTKYEILTLNLTAVANEEILITQQSISCKKLQNSNTSLKYLVSTSHKDSGHKYKINFVARKEQIYVCINEQQTII